MARSSRRLSGSVAAFPLFVTAALLVPACGHDKPAAGAIIVLVPEGEKRSRAYLFRQVETDQNGRFQMKTIPPGSYKLFAWDDVEDDIWFDTEFLKRFEDKGQSIAVKAKEVVSAQLRLLSVGDH